MKLSKYLFILFITISSTLVTDSYSQILKPVKWSFRTNKVAGNEANLVLTATIDYNWYLYSQSVPKGGPIATSFKFEPSANYELIGKVKEQEPEVKYDDNFEMTLKVFHNSAVFVQKVRVLSSKNFTIKGTLEFMCCNNKQCLPPDEVNFSFNLEGVPGGGQKSEVGGQKSEALVANERQQKEDALVANERQKADASTSLSMRKDTVNKTSQVLKTSEVSIQEGSLWTFLLIALIAGFAGTLTPCVFPMIPMTVTFFLNVGTESGNTAKRRRKSIISAIIYGLSIIFIYTVIGVLVSLLKSDPDTLNNISTHWLTNMIFFSLFIVFAASFFGVFEMTLPSWLITKSDKQVDKGGYIAAFFMALTLVLVSFSCTGPIIGAILIEATGGHMLKPIVGMFGFGLAFSIPFVVLALFPSLLGNLPKSGGWLNSIKIVMAFIILAFSLKFFVSADQVYHWGLLSREIFIAIWIVIFSLLGFYLLGKLRFKIDSALHFISFQRIMLAIVSFTFVVYLFTGLFGAPLKLISGFLPPPSSPQSTVHSPQSTDLSSQSASSISLCDVPKYSDILHLPYNLEGYFDYKQGLACARKLNKPIFVVFTGHACGNCHKMENDVWSNPEVLKRLREDFVVIMLYADDRTELPKSEWVTSTYDGKVKNTIGKLNADLRITRFNANIQPYYVLLGTDEKLLTAPKAYDLNVDNFIKFLDSGIKGFKDSSDL